jgi:hypothetical protein
VTITCCIGSLPPEVVDIILSLAAKANREDGNQSFGLWFLWRKGFLLRAAKTRDLLYDRSDSEPVMKSNVNLARIVPITVVDDA